MADRHSAKENGRERMVMPPRAATRIPRLPADPFSFRVTAESQHIRSGQA